MGGPREHELWDGRYRLERRLGAGGMASVWLARDERLGRDVAVKVLSDVLAGDREYIARFEREARVAAGLNHPNLVTIFDFAVAEERPYLVMELVSGGTVAAAGRFSPAEVERLAVELLAALEHIHAAGVIHRDLKPANVLIDDHDRFRLTDFGIAQPSDATALTQTGNLIGTMKYMAPEVRAGHRATVRSDLYSLGVLLRDSGGDSAPSLALLLAAVDRTDPADRPGSAEEAAALVGQAEPPTRRLPPTTPVRRRRPFVLAAAGALLAVAGVALALALGGGDEDATVGGGGSPPATTTEDAPAEAPAEQPEPKPEPPPETQPEPTAPTCDELAEQQKAVDEQRKAAEKAAGHDKEAREAIKEDFEAQKQAIEDQKKDCVK